MNENAERKRDKRSSKLTDRQTDRGYGKVTFEEEG